MVYFKVNAQNNKFGVKIHFIRFYLGGIQGCLRGGLVMGGVGLIVGSLIEIIKYGAVLSLDEGNDK